MQQISVLTPDLYLFQACLLQLFNLLATYWEFVASMEVIQRCAWQTLLQ